MEYKKLEKKPFFTRQEALSEGLTSRMINYYMNKGLIIRISQGVYSFTSYEPDSNDLKWSDLAIAAKNIKGGVICLTSALSYYELTDEIMKELWIAVENSNTRAGFPMTNVIRMRNIETGVKTINLAGVKVKIFDVERTVVDSFKHLDFETAMKAMKLYLKGHCGKPNISKLTKYTKELRASKVQDYITAVMA